MNKTVLMVLAVIVALLAGWLVLSVATTEQGDGSAPAEAFIPPTDPPAVMSPEQTDITLTIVEPEESSLELIIE